MATGTPLSDAKVRHSASVPNLPLLDTTDASIVKPDPEGSSPACQAPNTTSFISLKAGSKQQPVGPADVPGLVKLATAPLSCNVLCLPSDTTVVMAPDEYVLCRSKLQGCS